MYLTLEEVLHTCDDWQKFCQEKGFCEWVVNEGGGHIEVGLTEEEAHYYGITRRQP